MHGVSCPGTTWMAGGGQKGEGAERELSRHKLAWRGWRGGRQGGEKEGAGGRGGNVGLAGVPNLTWTGWMGILPLRSIA
eukprot:364810-Chlamydomonas_euryale.AAC.9